MIRYNKKNYEKGFSLFEVLIAIAIFGVVGALAAQLIGISLYSETASGQKTVALQLGQETAEAMDAFAAEAWQNAYGLAKGAANKYHLAVSGSKWATSASEEILTVNGTQYKRYFFVENVSRDGSGAITASGGNDDPSTQKITAVVSWQNSGGLDIGAATTTKYIMRARNAAATQTDWSGAAAPTAGENGGFGTNYAFINSITTPAGTLQLTAQ